MITMIKNDNGRYNSDNHYYNNSNDNNDANR